MFCAYCGGVTAEGKFCATCGNPVPTSTAAASPNAMGSAAAATLARGPDMQKLRGVRGWLLLFCITATIITPLYMLAEAGNFPDQAPVVIIDVSMGLLACFAGLSVWTKRSWAFLVLKIYFIAGLALGLYGFYQISQLDNFVTQSNGIRLGIRNIGYVIIWSSYFHKSNRVRATFGRNLWG